MLADSARNTLHLLNNLIDRERLHAGRLQLHLEPARLKPVVDAVVRELTPAATVRGIVLRTDLPSDEKLLLLDALRLQQVVRNLLANAIKYSGQGTVNVQASVVGPAGAHEVLVSVLDRGQGIAPERMAQLFEPFSGAPGVASSAGLGLPLCRDLAQLMAGSLQVLTREGGGTAAVLRFPVQLMEAPPVPAASALQQPLRVLVVEDAEVYSLLLVHALQQRGHQAQAVASLAAARAALLAGAHDLVLSDVNLPDGDAVELLQWMHTQRLQRLQQLQRPQPQQPFPRVVVMTADRASAPAALAALLQGQPLLEKTDDVRSLLDQALQPGLQAGPE